VGAAEKAEEERRKKRKVHTKRKWRKGNERVE